jgi:hypothetical protein
VIAIAAYECHGFGAIRQAKSANHIDPVANSVDNLGELVKWAPRPVELRSRRFFGRVRREPVKQHSYSP